MSFDPNKARMPTSRRRKPWRRIAAQAFQLSVASILALIVLIPVMVSIYGGFRSHSELLREPFSPPSRLHVENYISVLQNSSFWRMMGNSAFIGIMTVLITLLLSAPSAYVFARIRFRFREFFYNFFILGFFFPLAVALLPLYLIIRDLRLLDTHWAVILPQVAFGLPFNILVLRRFFAQIPRELEEAAIIDGASYIQMLVYIFLPLMRPALAAVSVLIFIGSWNSFFWPLLVLNTESRYTLPLGVMQFSTQYGGLDLGRVLAYVSMAMIPALIFYLFAERHIVTGLTAGALKR